jgi:CBS domain containing-hemolysin-like protein
VFRPPRAAAADPDATPGLETHDLLARMTAFQALRVEDVMCPRSDIVALEVGTPLGEAVRVFAEAAHSRLPVYRETLDDPLGMVHIKDLIGVLAPEQDRPWPADLASRRVLESTLRQVLYVPPSMRAVDLLLRMQTRRIHMALVVDEYGGTDGLVTLEDVVEPIVGDIEDEHDEADGPRIRARGAHVWEADARCSIDEFEAMVGREIATEEEDEDVDTLGGLVFTIAGRVPERGEIIVHPAGFEFEVTEADPRRVKRVLARETAKAPEQP